MILFIIFQIRNVLTAPAPQDPTTPVATTDPTLPTETTTPASRINVVSTCVIPGVVALTFDDGPAEFTNGLLDLLKAENVNATFFVNGKNYGCIYDYADVLIRAKAEGHQIGSHIWSHLRLSKLTADRIDQEVKLLDDALEKIVGVKPKYVRPPFGDGAENSIVQGVLADNGYTDIVLWDIDAGDGDNASLDYSVKQYTIATLPPASHISLSHDPKETTVKSLAAQEIKIMRENGFRFVTVGECLGNPTENLWYKSSIPPSTRDNATWVCP